MMADRCVTNMVAKTIIINGRNPKSKERRRKLPNSILNGLRARDRQSLYFWQEGATVIVTTHASQRGDLLFSITADYENRSRLSETNLKKMGAVFEDVLKFEFTDEGKAIVSAPRQKSEDKERNVQPPLVRVKSRGESTVKELKRWRSEVEQPSIEQALGVGAGFGNPETNRKIERAAVSFVTHWYESRGWKVRSVEAEKRGYDLLCVKGAVEEHVEVKGMQGDLPSFIITVGEVRQARNNSNFVICVVTSALKRNPMLFRYVGEEFVKSFDLVPLAFRAILREDKNG